MPGCLVLGHPLSEQGGRGPEPESLIEDGWVQGLWPDLFAHGRSHLLS